MTNTPVADLVAVKPLEWEDFGGNGAKATAMLIVSYLIARWYNGQFEISVSAPGYSFGFDGERFHPTLESAKAAAQADYEARIVAALTPVATSETPDACQQEDLVTAEPVIWAWPSGNAACTSIYPDDGDTDTVGLVKYIRADLASTHVTVEAAAKVLLDQPYTVMRKAFDAMDKMQGEGADNIMSAALRTLSEEKS